MKLYNPFVIYGYVSPEYFCDRQEETAALVSAMRNGRNITAKEGKVQLVNSVAFIHKYSLKGTSSVNKALSYLLENELVYRYESGYQVYDRFMTLWLQRI